MTYTGSMLLRIALFAIPTALAVALVLLLNGLGASGGVAAVALGVFAVTSGGVFGYFADRLPAFPHPRRPRSLTPHHVD